MLRDFTGLVVRSVRRRKVDFIAVTALGFLGAAAQVGAITSLLGFFRLMGKAGTADTLHWQGLDIPTGVPGLVVVSAVLATMLVIAALANYFSVRRARAIGRSCSQDTVLRLFDLVRRAESLPEGMSARDIRSMGVRSSRLAGICVENAIRLLHPLIQVSVLAGGMFWLDWWATVMFLPVLLVPVPVLWRFNRSVRASAREFYDSAAEGFGRAVGDTLDSLQHTRNQSEVLASSALEGYREIPAVDRFFDSYDDLHLTSSRATLITALARPLVMVYVLLLLGVQVGVSGLSWPDAMAFFVVLVQLTSRVEGVVAQSSVLARLYTQVEPVVRFEKHVEARVGSGEDIPPEVMAEPIVITHEDGRATAVPGHRLQVFAPGPFHRLELGRFMNEIEPAVGSGLKRLSHAAFVGRRYRPAGATGARLLTGLAEPTDAALARVVRLAEAMDVGPEVRATLDRTVAVADWEHFAPGVRAVFQVGPIVCGDSTAVLIELSIVSQLDRQQAETLLGQLDDRAVVLLAPNHLSSFAYAKDVVAVVDGSVRWAGPAEAWGTSSVRAGLAANAPSDRDIDLDAALEEELVDD